MDSHDPASSASVLFARYGRGRQVFSHVSAQRLPSYTVPDTCHGYTISRATY
jgi:hypothetical protein